MSDTSPEDPYAAILALAERGLQLARGEDLDGLRSLSERWSEVVAGLPDEPPLSARPRLQRATAIHQRTQVELLRLREALLGDLRRTAQAGRAASGYARNVGRRQRVDHSA